MRRHRGDRPVTIPLLNAAWEAVKRSEARRDRSVLLNQIDQPAQPEPVSAKQIDALDDGALDRLYHDSLRAFAQSARRGPGVLA